MSNIHIIGEAGVNHNGNLDNALLLVDIAQECGADSVKFQIINPWGLYLPGKYKYGHYDIEKVIEMRFSTVFSDEEYIRIYNYANEKNIGFSASIFDSQGIELLLKMNPPYIKIASTDLNNHQLLEQVAETGKKIILSTGMSDLSEIEESLNIVAKKTNDIILLHCVSIYPAPLEKTNLSFISTLQEKFGFEVGFSDHTRTNEASIAAYMLGARWFEKHYTFDNSLEGFDHKHAQSQDEFKSYINALRSLELSLKKKNQKVSPDEAYTAQRARRSLYAKKDLKAGDIIKSEDILVVRPSNIMKANEIDLVIGSKLVTDISQHQPFNPNQFERS